ncbi:MAG: myo-inositol 2-dehydrogenase / D-chiro-inositol 1-dehydrogenase, partial [Pseudonocardiales bacterium]|nr:myo-inositol 2-dehydrogenase / D-chiro-inositol 1-dehydrogenase [Pseudonocardiales bacterium]
MRLGLIGLGRIGAFHAMTLSGLVDELVVTDAVPAVAEKVGAQVGATVVDSPETL